MRLHQWLLGEEQTIDFVIHSERVVVIGCTHGLLGHLTLIHVSWRLVILREGLHSCDDTQNVNGVKFLMSRVGSDIFLQTSNRHIELLQRSDPLSATDLKVPHRTHKASHSRCEINPWEEFVLVGLCLRRLLLVLVFFFLFESGRKVGDLKGTRD